MARVVFQIKRQGHRQGSLYVLTLSEQVQWVQRWQGALRCSAILRRGTKGVPRVCEAPASCVPSDGLTHSSATRTMRRQDITSIMTRPDRGQHPHCVLSVLHQSASCSICNHTHMLCVHTVNIYSIYSTMFTVYVNIFIIEGSLEVKLPTIWRDEKQSRAEAERRGRLEERRSEEKE